MSTKSKARKANRCPTSRKASSRTTIDVNSSTAVTEVASIFNTYAENARDPWEEACDMLNEDVFSAALVAELFENYCVTDESCTIKTTIDKATAIAEEIIDSMLEKAYNDSWPKMEKYLVEHIEDSVMYIDHTIPLMTFPNWKEEIKNLRQLIEDHGVRALLHS